MKKILPILTAFALLFTACGATGSTGSTSSQPETTAVTETTAGSSQTTAETTAAPQDKVADYFPFTADTHMLYKGTGNEYAQYDAYVDYIKDNAMQIRVNNGGTEAAAVFILRDGALIQTLNKGEVYYRYDYTSMKDGEDILLKEPLAVGTAWTAKDGSERSITAVDAAVETPAGKFTALEVTTRRKDATDIDYFVKGTGLVKTEYKSADGAMTVTSELEKVETNVPFKQKVRFFYPQFDKDRIVYVEREISLKTNEDMAAKFEAELKSIPAEGGLGKTLTANTKVLGITLAGDNEPVTVNLSSDFVKEMNAGTSLELMLVDSITNTFGVYYQKDRVIILIDGKPYESGHILMKQGEAFKVKENVAALK